MLHPLKMMADDSNSTAAAPVRARSNDPAPLPERFPDDPPIVLGEEQHPPQVPPARPRMHAGISDDLLVPWGWAEVAMFVVLGVVGSAVVTWGLAEVAVRIFGINPSDVFGETISTAKSVIVLVSQAALDVCAILFLYVLLLTRTSGPFWQAIGWREMRPGTGTIRDSALQYLAGGAVLAIVVSFVGGFLNPKETLPIEELLKARVSVLLFGILGVLVAPVVEETIFRGFLYPVVARRLGVSAGVAITGTLFGLMHAAQLWGGWGQIALLILVGVALTWVRARTGTVAASYFVHLGYNGLQLVGYLIYVIGGARH
ncbi:MAG TPA: CPBP family intramembrane glutamic endopeptidase [Candidatus Acidoferrales bacterium]|nr:CPBP family intramembrane glutamic endopeptidase [Candidatus Acidoferrales bacterium]